MTLRWLLPAAVFVALTGSAAAAGDGDRATFRTMIDRQISAFRQDDATAAWDLASPGIHGLFGSAETFLDMVRRGYPPVYRPQRYEFGETREIGEGAEQVVRIDDQDGVGWTAIYSFEKQSDGSWAISGCRLVKAPDQSV